ncbi:MAG: hypothetical protein WCR27_05640 [Eubacteriales bacterium]
MEIRYKLFPYPVLSSFSDDYVKSGFISEVNVIRDIKDLVFSLKVLIDDEELLSLIEQNKAEYVFHIECSQTSYRSIIKTSQTENTKRIHESKLKGRVSVCSFIVASKSLTDYFNSNFNDDYKGYKFNIERGGILAIGNQFNIDITKETEDLAKVPSVFSVLKRDSDDDLGMQIEFDGDKVKLWLCNEEFDNYRKIASLPIFQPLLHSALILPALVHIFETLKYAGTDEYEVYRWFRAIESNLQKYGLKLDQETLDSRPSYELAQKLLEFPISRGLKSILSVGMEEEEEEE